MIISSYFVQCDGGTEWLLNEDESDRALFDNEHAARRAAIRDHDWRAVDNGFNEDLICPKCQDRMAAVRGLLKE